MPLKIIFLFLAAAFLAMPAHARIRVRYLESHFAVQESSLLKALSTHYALERYSEARIQISAGPHRLQAGPSRAIIYLIAKDTHRLDVARALFDREGRVTDVERDYQTQPSDREALLSPRCPDESVEFIAFAPVDHPTEQRITHDVADYAQAHGLKTVRLMMKSATRQAYLNYMSCPNLKGNFYNGDSNPNEFVTYDGTITAEEMTIHLGAAFRFRVTNIWLACRAFNPPMLPALVDSAQAQKYAAGLNDLIVGPSDDTAACAMKAAIDGKPMRKSFSDCYDKFDTTADKWGFDGKGSDLFGR